MTDGSGEDGRRVVRVQSQELPDDLKALYAELDAEMPSRADKPARRKKRRTGPPLLPSMPDLKVWAPAIAAGTAAAVALSLIVNAIEIGTGFSFRLLAVASGSAIGLAVRAAAPEPRAMTNRVVASILTYFCLASTYWYWFTMAILHPEQFGIDVEVAAAVGIQDWSAPAPAVSGETVDWLMAVVVGGFQSLVFPFYLLSYLNVWGVIFLILAIGQAWKLSVHE